MINSTFDDAYRDTLSFGCYDLCVVKKVSKNAIYNEFMCRFKTFFKKKRKKERKKERKPTKIT